MERFKLEQAKELSALFEKEMTDIYGAIKTAAAQGVTAIHYIDRHQLKDAMQRWLEDDGYKCEVNPITDKLNRIVISGWITVQ